MKEYLYYLYDFFTFKQHFWLSKFNYLEFCSIENLRIFQLEKLKELNKHYDFLQIQSWEDFYNLPITTKQNLPSTATYPKKTLRQHETSGSTGEPRIIWVPKESWNRKDAIFSRSWIRMGRKPSDKVLRLISGEPKYKFYDWLRNVYPMNYKTLDNSYVEWVVKNKPFLIHGPGGSIRQLCEMIIDAGHIDVLKDIKIHWCSESSEGHRQRLEPLVKEFHEQYGLAELPTVAATDGKGNCRVVMEQGIIEILDENNNTVPEGEEGFIVVTDFNNYQTPIIRYKCGDRGKIKKSKDDYYILYDIIGRGVDYYNGPEVKKPIGWWVVSPISHTVGDIISKWRCEIDVKQKLLTLYVEFKDKKDFDALLPYSKWVYDNVGLQTQFLEALPEKYDIYWKNKLIKVK